jgi:HPt (histidine-containing phosphotransfer) domain-containing protein
MRYAHDLKSVAGTLGMPALQRAAVALEDACMQRVDAASLDALLREVQRQLTSVLASMPE